MFSPWPTGDSRRAGYDRRGIDTSLPLRMALSCLSAPAGVLLFQFHWEIDSLILCTALLAVSLWALYALRMRYVAKRMLELMESRTEERDTCLAAGA